jgi:hypothetical protein
MERSGFGQASTTLPLTATEDEQIERDGIESVTQAAGGTLLPVIGQVETYFDRVATELSGVYLLGIEVTPTDRDGKPHLVNVRVNRNGLSVRGRKQYVIQPRAAGPQLDTDPDAARRGEAAGPALRRVRREPRGMTPDVEVLVARAGDYVLPTRRRSRPSSGKSTVGRSSTGISGRR